MATQGSGWKLSDAQVQRIAVAMIEGEEARKHRKGRPPKPPPSFEERLRKHFAKPGRPRRWDADLSRVLLELSDRWNAGERPKGERATNAAFLRWLCQQHANATGTRLSDVQREEFGALRNALSCARRRFVLKP